MSTYTISIDGRSFHVEFKSRIGSRMIFLVEGHEYQIELTHTTSGAATPSAKKPLHGQRQPKTTELRAPMPGIISDVTATPGLAVKAGDILAIIEAMKMENPIKATSDGVVDQVMVTKGQEVTTGATLVTFQK
jgi:biotin carboxyl carrier protein